MKTRPSESAGSSGSNFDNTSQTWTHAESDGSATDDKGRSVLPLDLAQHVPGVLDDETTRREDIYPGDRRIFKSLES